MSEPSAVTSCRFASSAANLPLFAHLPLCTWKGGAEVAGRSGVLVGGMQMRAWQRRADVRG
jgi:hypothetical protein